MGRATEHTDIALTAEDALLIEDIYHKASETYGESLEWADATRDDQIEIIGDVGELTFQGTRYLGFDRRGTAEPASEEPPIRSTEKKSWDPEL